MRPIQITLGATGTSNWTPLDYRAHAFGVGFHTTVGGDAAPDMTYTVEHAFSSMNYDTEVHITRSTTTATLKFLAVYDHNNNEVPWVNHGLAVGDNVLVASPTAVFDTGATGAAVASVVDNRTITYTVANTGPTVAGAGTFVLRLYVATTPVDGVTTGLTGSADGNYAFPPNFVRLNVSAHTAGTLTLSANQGQP